MIKELARTVVRGMSVTPCTRMVTVWVLRLSTTISSASTLRRTILSWPSMASPAPLITIRPSTVTFSSSTWPRSMPPVRYRLP